MHSLIYYFNTKKYIEVNPAVAMSQEIKYIETAVLFYYIRKHVNNNLIVKPMKTTQSGKYTESIVLFNYIYIMI